MEENNDWITWVVIIVIVYAGYNLFGSNESEYSAQSDNNVSSDYGSYENSYYGENAVTDLGNPYDEGSGHFAGYEWAQDNDVSSCDGNSNSFIEGCEEYLLQQEGY